MSKNICKVCNAIVDDSEILCPFCGTRLSESKPKSPNNSIGSSYYGTSQNSSSVDNNTYTSSYSAQAHPHTAIDRSPDFIPYSHTRPASPTMPSYPPKNFNGNQNKTVKKIVIFFAIMFAVINVFVIALAFIGAAVEESDAQKISAIFSQEVNTEKLHTIPFEDREIVSRVNNNPYILQNDKYIILKNEADAVSLDDETQYIYTYFDKPNSINQFSTTPYRCEIDTDDFRITTSVIRCEDKEDVFVYGDDTFSKLSNITIDDVFFEVYELKSYSTTEYLYFMYHENLNGMMNGKLLKIVVAFDNEKAFDHTDIIRYVKVSEN